MTTTPHRLAVIGGTGVYDPRMLSSLWEDTMSTPFGSVPYQSGTFGRSGSCLFVTSWRWTFHTAAFN